MKINKMPIETFFVQTENKERKIILLESEIAEIIDELERVPYVTFKWMGYDLLIKKLKQEENKNGKEKTKKSSKERTGKENKKSR